MLPNHVILASLFLLVNIPAFGRLLSLGKKKYELNLLNDTSHDLLVNDGSGLLSRQNQQNVATSNGLAGKLQPCQFRLGGLPFLVKFKKNFSLTDDNVFFGRSECTVDIGNLPDGRIHIRISKWRLIQRYDLFYK